MKSKILIISSLLIFTQFSFAQASSLVMNSEVGDYIGQGENYNITESDGVFTASVLFNGDISIYYSGGGSDFFSVAIGSKENMDLIPGPYFNATQHPFNSPTKPGFNASGFGRSCGDSISNFTILEIEINDSDELLRFAATFEQHCESIDSPALIGTIRYQSVGNMPIADNDSDTLPNTIDNCIDVANLNQSDVDRDGIGDLCDSEFTDTFFNLDSEEGEYIGQGIFQEFYLADGNIKASRNFDNGVKIDYDGAHSWTLNFAAPGDVDLTVGAYSMATRHPFQDVSEPGLSISGAGRGCNTLDGNFTVITVEYDDEGEVEKFEAIFEQHCTDIDNPALFGRVHYNGNSDKIFKNSFE